MSRPISKWCRYGFWSEDGTILYKTYERAKLYNRPVILFEQGQAYVNRPVARELQDSAFSNFLAGIIGREG